MEAVRTITIDELAASLRDGSVAEFWNVLTDDYFTGEMIPGSRRVPLDRIGRTVAGNALPRDAAIVVYCAGPTCPQSRQAAEKLSSLGFTNVRAFEGGLEEWKSASREIARAA